VPFPLRETNWSRVQRPTTSWRRWPVMRSAPAFQKTIF
jgi:hypothetical protein